jgi:hypothetical protein
METARRRTVVACLATAACLTAACLALGGCSGTSDPAADGRRNKNAKGAVAEDVNAAPPSRTGSRTAPAFDLPADLKVRIEPPEPTGDARKDAVLRDIGYAAAAQIEAFARGTGDTPNMRRYYAGEATPYLNDTIAGYHGKGRTLTGTYVYYGFTLDALGAHTADGHYCEDQQLAYSKEIRTGRILTTRRSDDSYVGTRFRAEKSARGDWQVRTYVAERATSSCVRHRPTG